MRLIRVARVRPGALVSLAVALFVAVATVGILAGWYGTGVPNHLPSSEPFGVGATLPKTATLLPLSFPDPQGGPPWGLRVIRTQFGSCQQIGRVVNGQLGTLGIDGYWHNDQQFHRLSTSWVGGQCGTGSSLGTYDGRVDASGASPGNDSGSPTAGCTLMPVAANGGSVGSGATSPDDCPAGSQRIFIAGQLRASVQSITYRKPDGTTATEQTVGAHGSFLLIFQLDARSCSFYFDGELTPSGCAPLPAHSKKPAKPGNPVTRAIKDINLRNGEVCPVEVPALFSHCPAAGTGTSTSG